MKHYQLGTNFQLMLNNKQKKQEESNLQHQAQHQAGAVVKDDGEKNK